jgi:hypothetical protein
LYLRLPCMGATILPVEKSGRSRPTEYDCFADFARLCVHACEIQFEQPANLPGDTGMNTLSCPRNVLMLLAIGRNEG